MIRKRGKFFVLLAGLLFIGGMGFLFLKGPQFPRDFGTAVHFSDGSLMRVYLTHDGRRRYWFPLKKMDPLLIKATLCYEDRRFYFHPGVDPLAVSRALWQNLLKGKVVSGASTITLQLVRLLKPGPRTLWRKIEEAFWALQLEMRHRKDEILEYYLNLAPYGGNLEGVASASLIYWGRLPSHLTPAEVAYLVSLPQAPIRGKKRSIKARNRVLSKMRQAGLITPQQEIKARAAGLPKTIHPLPFRAPHAADFVKTRHPGQVHLVTTLDPRIQASVERVVQAHKERILTLGATQASVIVIENATRKVKALVGSFDFWNLDDEGQVIGFLASRSPGSALKPFLYALALQDGFITPETRLEDRPKTFGDFRPVNFSPRFRGMIPAKTALALSLNLPFVNLLKEVGTKRFLSFLGETGLSWNKDPGLTAITGGIEIALYDLANLYVSLARGGLFGKARILEETPLKEHPWIVPGAAYLTLQALKHPTRQPINEGVDLAWKTGTSFGQRDAWAFGVTPQYTIGVWVGRFDGGGVQGLIGAKAALPLMRDLSKVLGSSHSRNFKPPRNGLRWIDICPDSGLPAGPYCPKTITVPFPQGVSLPPRCRWHRPFLVEKHSGYRACPWKRYAPGELIRKVFLVVPGHPLPPFSPSCRVEDEGGDVRILSPVADTLYLLAKEGPYSRGLPLKGLSDDSKRVLYWFVNGRFFAKCHSGDVLFITPPRGRIDIRLVDEAGHWSRVESWVDYTASSSHASLPYGVKGNRKNL